MSRRRRLDGRTLGSAVQEFSIDYEQIKHIAIGQAVHSDAFSAGGYMWRVNFYPYGEVEAESDKKYVSIYFELLSETGGGVKAIYEAFLVDQCGYPFSQTAKRYIGIFNRNGEGGWNQFVVRSDLEEHYLAEGHFTLMCAIMVVPDSSIPVPASDIGKHFGTLLDNMDGTDVSFTIESETFHAHRVVLAARRFSKLSSLALWLSLQCPPSPYMTLPLLHLESCFGSCTQIPSQELTSLVTQLIC